MMATVWIIGRQLEESALRKLRKSGIIQVLARDFGIQT
jgi:hypothetical protein